MNSEKIFMPVSSPVQVGYFHLNPVCSYCQRDAEVIRVTVAGDGEMFVATLCVGHAAGERQHAVQEYGVDAVTMENDGD